MTRFADVHDMVHWTASRRPETTISGLFRYSPAMPASPFSWFCRRLSAATVFPFAFLTQG